MKQEATTVLLYGHDKNLLDTRQWVLQTRGYRALTAMDLNEMDAVPRTRRMDLLLVCHSVPAEEREAALAAALARWPMIRNRTLTVEHGRMPNGILGQLLHTMDGPAKLISLVGAAMQDPVPQARAS